MSGAFTVTRTSTYSCNLVAIKNSVKIVKYLEFLANIYSTIAGNGVCKSGNTVYVIIALHLFYVLYK